MSVIELPNEFYLSSMQSDDAESLVHYLNDRAIHLNTLSIPYPYGEDEARSWITHRALRTSEEPSETSFALRTSSGELIGALGVDGLKVGESHRAEVGYWLARPYWGRGVMTQALDAFVPYAFTTLRLSRLTAHVFERNVASQRVLEKCGFVLEGRLRRHFVKDAEILDARVYGLLASDKEMQGRRREGEKS